MDALPALTEDFVKDLLDRERDLAARKMFDEVAEWLSHTHGGPRLAKDLKERGIEGMRFANSLDGRAAKDMERYNVTSAKIG